MPRSSVTPPSLNFKLVAGFWNTVPPELISPLTDKFTTQARCALRERDIAEPDPERLRLIAMAAAESMCLLHDAALDPTQEDFDYHFADFVVCAVAGYLDH